MTSAEQTYLFRHAILQEAAYGLQPVSERAHLHGLALQVLEKTATTAQAAELSQHARLAQMAEGADVPALQAIELRYLWQAAEDASANFQYEAAAKMFAVVAEHPGETNERRVTALRNAGHVFHFVGRPRDGRPYLERAVQMARGMKLRRELGSALSSLALVLEYTGELEEAEKLQLEALAACRESGNIDGEIAALTNMGNLRATNRVALAEENLREALVLARAHADRGTQGRVQASIANLMRMTGRAAEARQGFEEALATFRDIADAASEANVLGNLGVLMQQTGHLPEAEELYTQALQMRRQAGNRYHEALLLGNLGILQMLVGRVAGAEPLFRQSLAMRREVGDRRGEADALCNLANMLSDTGRQPEAEAALRQALTLDRGIRNRRGEGNTLAGLGSVMRAMGRFDEAIEYFNQALVPLHETSSRAVIAGTLCEYGLTLLEAGYPGGKEKWLEGAGILAELGDDAEYQYRERAMLAACAKGGAEPFTASE